MTKTRRALFCRWVQQTYPELYACSDELDKKDPISLAQPRHVTDSESMVYAISRMVNYPHTPDANTFYNKSHKKQKKYVKNLHRFIEENPEVTTFCLL